MIPKHVISAAVFEEFTKEEAESFFGCTEKKVLPHFDNIYYTVSIAGDHGDVDKILPGVKLLIEDLQLLREQKAQSYETQLDYLGMHYARSNYAIYQHRLTQEEDFDIYIADFLPTDDTPRIAVQIRSRLLVLEGSEEALKRSLGKVKLLLSQHDLKVDGECLVNRVDYAYHTNLIQDMTNMFKDENLLKHMSAKFRKGQKVFDIGKDIVLSYLSLGKRQSNCCFFRIYDKTREVIEKNYKAFFFDRWQEKGLISSYDFEVLRYAFETKSYVSGLLVGRINWYLKHGKNETLKAELEHLLKTCYVKNSNNDQIRAKIQGVLPEVTTVCNIEFEVKRKFFTLIEGLFELVDMSKKPDAPRPLHPIYRIMACHQTIHRYLTGTTLKFVEDRNEKDSPMMAWWERVHNTKCAEKDIYGELTRAYKRNLDKERARRRVMSDIAFAAMLIRESVDRKTFEEDVSDVLAFINDNDKAVDKSTGEYFGPESYDALFGRKAFQNKHLIAQMQRRTSGEKYDEEVDGMQLVADEFEEAYQRGQESKAENERIKARARAKAEKMRSQREKELSRQRLENHAKRLKGKEHL